MLHETRDQLKMNSSVIDSLHESSDVRLAPLAANITGRVAAAAAA